MIRADLIPRQRTEKRRVHSSKAVLASIVFHLIGFSALIGLTFYFGKKLEQMKSGSPERPAAISLPTLVIVASPAETPPPATVTVSPPQATPLSPPPPESLPLLSHETTKLAETPPLKTEPVPLPEKTSEPVVAQSTTTTPAPPKQAKAAPAFIPSSFAAGAAVMPHPPYPPAAISHGKAGTVVMNVTFNAQGGVQQAEVLKSSGVQLLDTTTRSYIRENWHNTTYAGQTVTIPVQYYLTK